MKLAQYGKGGDLVSLKAFMDRAGSDNPKEWVTKPHCPDCHEEVHAYDRRGARGFSAARDEVTKRVPRVKPGFSHYPVDPADATSPVLTCPSSFRDDPRFRSAQLANLMDSNEFRRDELERNRAVLLEPKMVKALEEVQRFLMQRLTGSSVISQEDRKDIQRITRGLITMVGLADHPWVLPYMQVLFIGARTRMTRSGSRSYRAAYNNEGSQKLPVTYANGETGRLTIPKSLVLGFKYRSGKITPMRQGRNGPKISFPVSRDFAASLARGIFQPSQPESAPPLPTGTHGRIVQRPAQRQQQLSLGF